MTQTTRPPTGNTANDIVAAYEKLVKEIIPVMDCEISKLTIVVAGRKSNELINRVFSFPAGSVPPEIFTFFHEVATRYQGIIDKTDESTFLLRLGNIVISLDDFLKDYRTGDHPSLDEASEFILRDLKVWEQVVININGRPYGVQRIN